LQINEGSTGPDYFSGPLWAIFDAGAVERAELNLTFPWVADNGYFFSADTLEELQAKINAAHKYQRVPMTHRDDLVLLWNGYVDAVVYSDLARCVPTVAGTTDAVLNKIARSKFYAASFVVVWHDSFGGVRMNGMC